MSPLYLRLRVWPHSQDPLADHLSGKKFVPNRGTPRCYLPGYYTGKDSQVTRDFDPPSRVVQLKFRSSEW